jgi:hypothetical protein
MPVFHAVVEVIGPQLEKSESHAISLESFATRPLPAPMSAQESAHINSMKPSAATIRVKGSIMENTPYRRVRRDRRRFVGARGVVTLKMQKPAPKSAIFSSDDNAYDGL